MRSLHKDIGSLKTLMVYFGKACATDFIRTSLQPAEQNFSFHIYAAILLLNRSPSDRKTPLGMGPFGVGRPRYILRLKLYLFHTQYGSEQLTLQTFRLISFRDKHN